MIVGAPEVPGAAEPGVERTGVVALYTLQQPRQGGLLMWHGDEVDVILAASSR